jgi:hypothetical protein
MGTVYHGIKYESNYIMAIAFNRESASATGKIWHLK